ncbi:1,4-alpha-glucan branching enzyme [Xanthomonas arboricola]|uniref:1,4-alpha-glucan branching enzyme n=1 Tax=Xanthomonas arboricola TaxID=56448 RepID=UPI0007EE13B0|nr:1,4-alpha-glucan branching enzyme [Xanthomonas arboricola]MBB6572402.1 1,4-alpha-glucan branching enzyme [Xanthomonas arboricola]OBR76752.1 1,4-alpha-glucan branching enzyme [Xanthomonas arboricola]PPT88087.1 1,4-alpha-glucan branching enzyme [Xanthomonas arboricola]CAE6701414.1 1,4-alpha-glucan branching enzyme GlgB [Xanthomonas arboricola]CAE6701441.1 1,4-alpha-glucan branching enzyme GlgB [Xanthomonas arboricola]
MSERLGVQGQETEATAVTMDGMSDLVQSVQALADGLPADAFAVLGPHSQADGRRLVRVLAPGAEAMGLIDPRGKLLARMQAGTVDGVFEGTLAVEGPYRLRIVWPDVVQEIEDPYAFAATLDESTLLQIAAGDGQALRRALGAQHLHCDDVPGVRFAVWAPHAQRVAVVGDFNGWDVRRHPMRPHIGGFWELFLPRVEAGTRYKYAITAADGRVLLKADPVARQSELPPATASVVPGAAAFAWTDAAWMAARDANAAPAPLSIYEVHAASWRRDGHNQPLDWPGLAVQLIPYVQQLGFTHIELLPITEHPFGGSWGYQPLGLYAPTARHGSPDGFAQFVDACHRAGIGVILDWVSAHFPDDAHGLAQFDGAAVYEHADPREGMHRDWNTLIYNYGRPEVTAYLLGSALEWIDHYHLDGLRVDAVASMLYRDYGRAEGEWVPNAHGGRENLEAVAFLRQLNSEIATRFPGVLSIAEESTAWPGVTAPISEGGLGFTHKWNMGWMHDTLSYMQRDPAERAQHHSQLTFGLVYAFSERFVLPISHDEVVHGTGGLLGQMPGDDWRRFANLRAYLALMWAHPGDKLLFMGAEFGQWNDWNHDQSLDWHLLDGAAHRGVQQLVGDLNATLRRVPALYRGTHRADGFDWSVADDAHNSVLAFIRHDPDGGAPLLVVSNLTPQPHHDYRVGVPRAGGWREILNTDSAHYGGSNLGNSGRLATEPMGMHGHAQRLRLTLPPLATIYLQAEK